MAEEIRTLIKEDTEFPQIFRDLKGSPEKIFLRGKMPEPELPLVAIVGTRKATNDGLEIAFNIGRELAENGVGIISGLALGIDGASHKGCLKGGGQTWGVLARGLDKVYPASHESLAKEMIEGGGGLISEYEIGTEAFPNQFLERNRIVSALAKAVVVIECPIPSGALTTAKHAAEQGKEVFVIPGSIYNPNYRGSHMLLREGARLATNAKEILEDLGWDTKKETAKEINDSPETKLLITTLTSEKSVSVDRLHLLTKLEPRVILQILAQLEIEGRIIENAGFFKLIKIPLEKPTL
jgi:DNA processing protein